MSALFHIQAPKTDAHYLSGTGVWQFNVKKEGEERRLFAKIVKRVYF